uniref:Uncharacterized protein n=1 Tax=Biomphalaria glabrata TaxID=6526 RepID=A0A2C9JTC5_BIOGL
MGILIDSVPDKSSIENCVRELGVISDLQAAEVVMATPGLTLGFDATTQEGVHVNSVHLTTKSNTLVIALDDLSGGTAEDYGNHICQAIQNLAGVYSNFHKTDLHECRDKIIQNISNTMSDRAPVNHATVMRLSELWDKSLTELNCHVHPLDSIAKGCTEALKTLQTEQGKLFGSDCLAGNIVLQLTKMRYKMGTGNPKAFVSFLVKEKLKKGLIPRYRGNRFHVLFHTSGILVLHSEQILDFLGSASALPCGGLTAALLYDLQLQTAKKQLYVMGLIGKLLTGPWMRKFYTSQDDVRNISYYEGVTVIKGVLARVNECLKNPFSIFTRSLDFFDEDLDANDPVLQVLLLCPQDMQVEHMFKDCLSSIASVIQRQYESFLCMDESELMKLEAESARSHNMDSEEVVGMFSAEKKRAPSATVCYISSKVRSKKNKTVAYLDSLTESARKERVEWAMGAARIRRRANKVRSSSVNEEIVKRAEQKARESEKRERKQIENLLRKEDFDRIRTEMKDVTEETLTNVVDILSGNIFGRLICHYWFDEGAHCGRIMRVKKEWKGKKVVYNKDVYEVSYWSIEEDESDGVDYDMNKYELACDVLFKDLTLM